MTFFLFHFSLSPSSLLIFFFLFLSKLKPNRSKICASEWKKCVKRWFDAPPELPNIQWLGFFYLI